MSAIAVIKKLIKDAGELDASYFPIGAVIEQFGEEGAEALFAEALEYCSPAIADMKATSQHLLSVASESQRNRIEQEIAKMQLSIFGMTCVKLGEQPTNRS